MRRQFRGPLFVALIVVGLAITLLVLTSPARAKGKPDKPPGKPPKPHATATVSTAEQAVASCSKYVEYTDCSQITWHIDDFGYTGWSGWAKPSTHEAWLNTTYVGQPWDTIVAHEAGGHIDTWDELVARVGVSQAWVDYYELDTLAAAKWPDVVKPKEFLIDCLGPVAHGLPGTYAGDGSRCGGAHDLVDQAVASP